MKGRREFLKVLGLAPLAALPLKPESVRRGWTEVVLNSPNGNAIGKMRVQLEEDGVLSIDHYVIGVTVTPHPNE